MTNPEKPTPDANALISSHPSTTGLQISLHPLALLTISDYITRHTLRNGSGPILGALLGTQQGRSIDIEHAYEILLLRTDDQISVDEPWFIEKLKLFKETHGTLDLLGWFTTTPSPTFAPSPWMVQFHRQLLPFNESLILLCLNPSPSASVGGGGTLPLAIYESVLEADDTADEGAPNLLFVPLNYTIETGEAEMIGVDFVAKGGFGNAAAELSGLEGTAQGAAAAAGAAESKDGAAKKVKLSDEAQQGKGKEKAEEKEPEAPVVSAGTQNDELLANLTAKANAIRMLHSRIKLLTTYLSNPPHPEPNHQLLRSLKSLTHSRLPLLTPADAKGFRQEQLSEQSDVHLVALLGTLTKSIEEVRGVGKKFWGIEQTGKANAAGRSGGGGGGGGMGEWSEGRRGERRYAGGGYGNF
ncbi:uncharacterized protein H6S33_006495 [Morchella sextelata]|uniref:uncharacterized protein n=1 Tax=Morchella sextelata TaxID=1174677 RepID=UPI001D03750C|nr:uncharacterized protein H6S33_006495 [Morchella sextelata]KAH0604827.1 hypothetical protein H6S33_006495 [Morchella sextelata]